jgi:hypothetical protein
VLQHLVETAYAPLLELGGADMDTDDLVNYFRVASSPSQARNASRFFRALMRLAGSPRSAARKREPAGHGSPSHGAGEPQAEEASEGSRQPSGKREEILAEAKARLLDKLPPPDPRWSAAEYAAIMDRFLDILQHLDS